jgi:hypothetical protein
MAGGARLSARVSPAHLIGPLWAELVCWAGPSWRLDLGLFYFSFIFFPKMPYMLLMFGNS